jgi:hypothetical protein
VAINVSITALAADLARGTGKYVTYMLGDTAARTRAETEFPAIEMQKLALGSNI